MWGVKDRNEKPGGWGFQPGEWTGSHATGRGREHRKRRGMVVERKPEDKDICLKGEGKRDEDLILVGDSRHGAERARHTHTGRQEGGAGEDKGPQAQPLKATGGDGLQGD